MFSNTTEHFRLFTFSCRTLIAVTVDFTSQSVFITSDVNHRYFVLFLLFKNVKIT